MYSSKWCIQHAFSSILENLVVQELQEEKKCQTWAKLTESNFGIFHVLQPDWVPCFQVLEKRTFKSLSKICSVINQTAVWGEFSFLDQLLFVNNGWLVAKVGTKLSHSLVIFKLVRIRLYFDNETCLNGSVVIIVVLRGYNSLHLRPFLCSLTNTLLIVAQLRASFGV